MKYYLLILAIALLLFAQQSDAREIVVGDKAEFDGIYCKYQDEAERIAMAYAVDNELGNIAYQNEWWCSMGKATVRIVDVVKQYGEWYVVEVQVLHNNKYYFVVTNTPIYLGVGA